MENVQPAPSPAPVRHAIVRSIPAMGRKFYYSGGSVGGPIKDDKGEVIGIAKGQSFRWPDTETKVAIVANPAPYTPTEDDPLPKEISDQDVVVLKADKRIAIQVIGEADATEAVLAKGEAARLAQEVKEVRLELAALAEQLATTRRGKEFAEGQAKIAGARVSELEAAEAQAQKRIKK